MNKHKPKYLNLESVEKQAILAELEKNTPNEDSKQIARECMLFLETIEQELKRPGVTVSKIKRLLALYEEKLKKLQLIQ